VIEFRLNGRAVRSAAPADETLLSALINDHDVNGAKYGCGRAQYGYCSADQYGVRCDRSSVPSLATHARACVGWLKGAESLGIGEKRDPLPKRVLPQRMIPG
jgi:nicotinate dehydrogenase subunit A